MPSTNKRIYRTKAEKLAILSRQKSSNHTVKAFCEQEGIHFTQFYMWKRNLQFSKHTPSRNDFIELSRPQHKHLLEIVLPNGIQIRSNKPEVVIDTVTALLNK